MKEGIAGEMTLTVGPCGSKGIRKPGYAGVADIAHVRGISSTGKLGLKTLRSIARLTFARK